MGNPGDHSPGLANRALETIANEFIRSSIADSTRTTYSIGQSTYLNFRRRFNLQPLPAPEQQLILFTADLSRRLSFSTIRSYLSAVRFWHVSNGYGDPLVGLPSGPVTKQSAVEELLKPSTRDKQHLPITPLILKKLYEVLNEDPSDYENKLVWATCCMGFFGFLPSGEFTSQSDMFDPTWRLSIQDIAVDSISNSSLLQVMIKGSKTVS